MSRWTHPRVSRPHADEEYAGMEVAHLLVSGSAHSEQAAPTTKKEQKERQEQLARKRPPGFAAWPKT